MKKLLATFLVILTVATAANASEKVKLSGAELAEQLTKNWTYAGSNAYGSVFMVVLEPGGKRELYWHDGQRSVVVKGRAFVKGDQFCVNDERRPEERCNDVYRLKDGSFEMWRNGEFNSTFRIVEEY